MFQGGIILFQLIDTYGPSGTSLLIIACFETIVIAWVYGKSCHWLKASEKLVSSKCQKAFAVRFTNSALNQYEAVVCDNFSSVKRAVCHRNISIISGALSPHYLPEGASLY